MTEKERLFYQATYGISYEKSHTEVNEYGTYEVGTYVGYTLPTKDNSVISPVTINYRFKENDG